MVEIGIALLTALVFWLVGGVALRSLGWIAIVAGVVVLAASGGASGLALAVAGVALWVLGHLHFAVRHRVWKSPLAQDLATALRAPTRRC